MKKIYCLISLGIILSASSLRAQLNGVYTIDNTLPASATNFTSFTQFAAALNAQGVSGPVTVNVGATSGPYNEQVEFLQYAGASATNSVVVNGNGRTLTFNATSAAARHTLMLSGADYMTWNNLRVIGTNATNALVVHLWNDANYNRFNDMYIEAPFNGTSSTQAPFSISGSNVTATTAGPAGSGNVVNTCTIVGGYYNTVFYGVSTPPYNEDNEVRNSILRDFYAYGFYNLYCLNSKAVGNIVERLNRTTVTTTYAMYLSTGSIANGLIEGNHIRKLYNGISGNASTTYCIYLIADATANDPNIVRNNVISDINNNGTLYGIMLSGSDYAYAEHNTVSLDDAGNTGGTTYGIYSTGANTMVRNNVVTIGRTGNGTKYGLYYTTAATGIVSDYNVVYVSSTAGTNYLASLTTNHTNLATWQNATGLDMNSFNVNPQYVNPPAMDYTPFNIAINNVALPIGVAFDFLGNARSPLTPDPGAYETYNLPCATAPPNNYFTVPSVSLCPGSQVELELQTTASYTNSGYTVQWYVSNNTTFGPYVAVPGATFNSHVTNPITGNVHYQAVITCTNANQSFTTLPGSLYLSPVIRDTVPYFEGFETLSLNGLPNCYWTASNFEDGTHIATAPASGNRAARTGTNYAYFENKAPFTNYFYTNQILLKTGVTYSAALWYITENIGFNQWPDLSIHIGTSQSPNGLQQIAAATPVTGHLYNLLSSTFSVASTGYYYVAVRSTGSVSGVAPYLTWDDLSITIPCSLNSPPLTVLSTSVEACQGIPVTLMAGGASAYNWSNGVQGPNNVVAPVTHSTYIVHGIDTLSRCSSSMAINVTVKPAPPVGAIASSYSVCSGQSATLSATGADSYYWSTGSTNSVTVVSPTTTSAYNLAGTNSLGCTSSVQVIVQVFPAPVLVANASRSVICQGEEVSLMAQGANTYMWMAPNLFASGNQLTLKPQSSAIYTVTGTTQNGCSVTSKLTVLVEGCTGIAKHSASNFNIFPNPVADQLFIQTNGETVNITVTDVSGRVIATQSAASELISIDMSNYSAGVYYVKLNSNNISRTEKFVKQ